MYRILSILAVCTLSFDATSSYGPAPSPCECSRKTTLDGRYGFTGNCKKSDYKEEPWCYVENPLSSACSDLKEAHDGGMWSYQACTLTVPERKSPCECLGETAGYNSNCIDEPWCNVKNPDTSTCNDLIYVQDGGVVSYQACTLRVRETTSICECINPFAGGNDWKLGEPDRLCDRQRSQCYVRANSDCNDKKRAAGGGRWTSELACDAWKGRISDNIVSFVQE